jgi:hypothetical protein
VVASSDESETVDFWDGSQIVLLPNASARVLETAPRSVRVLVQRGEARVHVTHAEDTNWLLEAGPYMVHVTGTVFTISWDASVEQFLLVLKQGSVVVTGPMLEDGKRIREGEQLAARLKEKRIEISSAEGAPSVPTPQPDVIVPEIPPEITDAPAESPVTASRVPGKARPVRAATTAGRAKSILNPWTDLCRAGEFGQVVELAKQQGLARVMQSGTSADLAALGDAARLTRNVGIANDAYTSVRARFSSTPQAAAAAFYLGKIAFDQRHAYGVAVDWLNTYLKESPKGPFARDALGKLIEAETKSGRRSAAQEHARLYLERHPGGPHTDIAKQTLGEY